MATVVKRFLSGSTDGQGIGVTASLGATYNTIHVASSGTTATVDEIYIYANNNFSSDLNLVLEFGASAAVTKIVQNIPAQTGPTLVVPGFLILGSATAATDILAYLDTTQSLATSGTSSLSIFGYVHRIAN